MPIAIGDTILGSGVISALSHRYPAARLVVFHGENNGPAVHLIDAKMKRVECRFTNPLATLLLLRKEQLDIAIDLMPWTRLTAIYARLAAPVAIGFNPIHQWRSAAFDIAVLHRGDVHELENYIKMASLFGNHPYRMNVITEHFENHQELQLERLVLCHAAAGGTRAGEKGWPAENWAQLARRLAVKGWQVGFTGALDDAPLVKDILIKAALSPEQAVSLCGAVPLGQLGALIRQAKLLITIDTGVLHLAAAVNGNILALHGPTRSAHWGACTANVTNLDPAYPAAGYIRYGYEAHPLGHQTMLAHRVEDVARAAFAKLGEHYDVCFTKA